VSSDCFAYRALLEDRVREENLEIRSVHLRPIEVTCGDHGGDDDDCNEKKINLFNDCMDLFSVSSR